MKELRIKGSHRNMGITFGKTLTQWHRQFKPTKEHIEFAWECEKAVKQHAPGLLEELEGISEVTGVSYETLISTNLAPAFMFGCTLFAVKGEHTSGGNPIFGRQHDWIEEDIEALHVIYTEPDDGHKSIGFSYGDFGRYGGQNDVGLTIGSAYVPMYIGKARPGVRMNISTRWALDNLSTYLKRIPHTEPVAFLVADRKGTFARVETTPERTAATYQEGGIEIVTNFFMLEEMRDLDKGLPEDSHVYEYYRRVQRWFEDNKGSITTDHAKTVCSEHETGICHHSDNSTEMTIWSWVTEIGQSLEIAQGSPCNNEYKLLKA
ncbi:MAG: C45 family autoproteolytic acyltransferase/hydrolase [Candidatus Thorarchaeota archaeon]